MKPSQFKTFSRVVNYVSVFNIALLVVDLVLIFISSRQVEKLYSELGIDAIYGIGVFNVQVLAAVVLLTTAAAKFKFLELSDKEISGLNAVILYVSFLALLFGSFMVIRIFLETITRL